MDRQWGGCELKKDIFNYPRINASGKNADDALLKEIFEVAIPTSFFNFLNYVVIQQAADHHARFTFGRHSGVAQSRDGDFIGVQFAILIEPGKHFGFGFVVKIPDKRFSFQAGGLPQTLSGGGVEHVLPASCLEVGGRSVHPKEENGD